MQLVFLLADQMFHMEFSYCVIRVELTGIKVNYVITGWTKLSHTIIVSYIF